jgi:glycosyltransferase involved in cell wall biosynthesis
MISVVVLTKNEEQDLPACLESIRWCDDVHVVDSGSTDQTVSLARELGAKVCVHPFESFGRQRNWAIDHCELRHEWILFLDADERSTPSFEKALLHAVVKSPPDVAGYYCCWKMMLGDRWLKRSDNFPKWQFRLFRKGRARFVDVGHGQKEGQVDGRIEYLREPYLHYAFSRGWDVWEERHRRYAKQEAKERFGKKLRWADLVSAHPSKRNPAIKQLVGNLPGWPSFRFFYSYVLKGGWREGREGWLYSRKILWYEQQTQRELRQLAAEHRRRRSGT